MMISCILTVIMVTSEGQVKEKEARLEGILLRQNQTMYFGNFQLDADLHKYKGSYTNVAVNKKDCEIIK